MKIDQIYAGIKNFRKSIQQQNSQLIQQNNHCIKSLLRERDLSLPSFNVPD